jgi:hypothetical protein
MIIFPVFEKVSEYIFLKKRDEANLFLKSFLVILIYVLFVVLIKNYFDTPELLYLKNN